MRTSKRSLTQLKAVKQYQKGNPDDNKDYPSLELVRLSLNIYPPKLKFFISSIFLMRF